MGMSTHVKAVKTADQQTLRMKAAYDGCLAAGVKVPQEVTAYFKKLGVYPESVSGEDVEVDVTGMDYCAEYHTDSGSGFEIDVENMPADIIKLRFYNTW
jgi:hypothetical protein